MPRVPSRRGIFAQVQQFAIVYAQMSETHQRIQSSAPTQESMKVIRAECGAVAAFYTERISLSVASAPPDGAAKLT